MYIYNLYVIIYILYIFCFKVFSYICVGGCCYRLFSEIIVYYFKVFLLVLNYKEFYILWLFFNLYSIIDLKYLFCIVRYSLFREGLIIKEVMGRL